MMVLRKGVYPYEYKDVWEKYQLKYLHSLPEKEDFYYHLNMEDITNADYTQAKKVCKDLWKIYVNTMFKVIHHC